MCDSSFGFKVQDLCELANVSKSGFYSWSKRPVKAENELEVDLIQTIFEAKKEKAGARTIKMILSRDFDLEMNLKKIRRLKKKYNLETKIRRKNKYAPVNVGEEHVIAPNLLDRSFTADKPDSIYSVDITYLFFGMNKKAYLFAVKDLHTKEIVHHYLSNKMDINLVMEGHASLYEKLPAEIRSNLISHSDQGTHFTAKAYRELLKYYGVRQSMSRRGNCLDNAPIESFFGHLKDEAEFTKCTCFEDLEKEIKKYINYYNNERPQWGLKRKTPAECRG